MKSIILLSLIISIYSSVISPNPVPLPTLNLSRVEGKWYVVLEFNSAYNNSFPITTTCFTWNITVEGSDINVIWENLIDDRLVTFSDQYDIEGSPNSIWTEVSTGNQLVWLDLDPISGSWALFANMDCQQAYLFSRNDNINTDILNAQISLLQNEGYGINDSNYYLIINDNCTLLQK